MAKSKVTIAVRNAVRTRANACCEYCKSQDLYAPHAFTIDHILPQHLNGTDDMDNLAYACFLCNRLKSNKPNFFDVVSEQWVPLYSPRTDLWSEHFVWSDDFTRILGLSIIGRCTIDALELNREKLVQYRKAILPFGKHPPH